MSFVSLVLPGVARACPHCLTHALWWWLRMILPRGRSVFQTVVYKQCGPLLLHAAICQALYWTTSACAELSINLTHLLAKSCMQRHFGPQRCQLKACLPRLSMAVLFRCPLGFLALSGVHQPVTTPFQLLVEMDLLVWSPRAVLL